MSQLQDTKLQNKFHNLFELLRRQSATIGFAESCTGGLLSSQLTSFPGVSDLFLGSVISYADSVKTEILKVSISSLRAEGAVSEVVAREMALGLKRLIHSTYSVSITGVAGPTGGSEKKPIGTVCFAICGPAFEEGPSESNLYIFSETQNFFGTRQQIQQAASEHALERLLEFVSSSAEKHSEVGTKENKLKTKIKKQKVIT